MKATTKATGTGGGHRLTFEFDNERALYHFKLWLCESGEQHYWDWMEAREEEEQGNITVGFDYHGDGSGAEGFASCRVVATNAFRIRCSVCGVVYCPDHESAEEEAPLSAHELACEHGFAPLSEAERLANVDREAGRYAHERGD